jgi:Mg/Co/Ni transporter MgtE
MGVSSRVLVDEIQIGLILTFAMGTVGVCVCVCVWVGVIGIRGTVYLK